MDADAIVLDLVHKLGGSEEVNEEMGAVAALSPSFAALIARADGRDMSDPLRRTQLRNALNSRLPRQKQVYILQCRGPAGPAHLRRMLTGAYDAW